MLIRFQKKESSNKKISKVNSDLHTHRHTEASVLSHIHMHTRIYEYTQEKSINSVSIMTVIS